MKSVYQHLTERSAPINKTELKIGEVYDGCVYLGELDGYNYYVAPKDTGKELPWAEAIKYCKNLKVDKLSDFFLPNKDELFFAYRQYKKHNLDFVKQLYWSSSEYSPTTAYLQGFANGNVYHNTKTSAVAFIAFRKEPI